MYVKHVSMATHWDTPSHISCMPPGRDRDLLYVRAMLEHASDRSEQESMFMCRNADCVTLKQTKCKTSIRIQSNNQKLD